MRMTREQRIELGKKRIISVLKRHGIATLRMLEQKIADAGPTPQRIDPHLLTHSRSQLQTEGKLITRIGIHQREWHHLPGSDEALIEQRFKELQELHSKTEARNFTLRMGQTAEIAVIRALQQSNSHFVGHFQDLDDHDDSTLYTKHDPDFVSGKQIKGGRLDYIVFHPDAGPMGIEVKNIREWIYPDRSIMKDLMAKCVQIDAVPVIVARRISYSTYSLLTDCGVVVHQFYNQLYPHADSALADAVKHKMTLGYFDVRVGSVPDARMLRFFEHNLPSVAKKAREKFDEHRDTMTAYADTRMSYKEFVARIRGRYDDGEQQEWEPDWD
jgi:hypothetical protein